MALVCVRYVQLYPQKKEVGGQRPSLYLAREEPRATGSLITNLWRRRTEMGNGIAFRTMGGLPAPPPPLLQTLLHPA